MRHTALQLLAVAILLALAAAWTKEGALSSQAGQTTEN
jgi:hypothetical protein